MTHPQSRKWGERRRFERKYLLFYLRVLDGNRGDVVGHLINFSDQGLMLVSYNDIEVPKEYKLRLRLPAVACEHDMVAFEAMSRWCRKDVNPDFYLSGYEVLDSELPGYKGKSSVVEQLSRLDDPRRIYRKTWNNNY